MFESVFGSRVPRLSEGDQLRASLFEAAWAGDSKQLERLCQENAQEIHLCFPAWRKVPDELRSDRAAMQHYVQGLISIAQTFADRLGSPQLLERLTGTPQSNPLTRWKESLTAARQLMGELRYGEARALLTDLLIDMRGLEGSGADAYLPITLGCLGECYFQSGEARQALPHLEQALRLCQQTGDAEGIAAYLGNFYEAHRWLGESGPAADCALRLADALAQQGKTPLGARYRRQAEIVRAGEPLNRVVAVIDGVTQELDEVRLGEKTRVQFVFERNRITLRPAREHTRRGEELGGAGRYEEALAAFEEAAQADPFDPHSRFLQGFTLLHLGRYADAVECYRQTEKLAPGWFHCRADLWLAEQLSLGTIEPAVFQALHQLEDGRQPPAEKVRLADEVLAQRPELAPVHLLRGKNLAVLGRRDEARAAYRKGLACHGDVDVRTRILVELGVSTEDAAERTALLREALALNGNLVAAASAYLALKARPQP
jgi:tetratricopeptide (TPR) repeat protein